MEEFLKELNAYLETPKKGIFDIERQKEVMESYKSIKNAIETEDSETTIELSPDPLQLGSVSIKITTPDITVYNMKEFIDSIKNADNFQIYPTTNGYVRFCISFNGVIQYSLL